ncbi:MAG: GNAT family N-acetyltransferase [Oligoflexia bacterium]|nr:GNAT family N-acetyltransferase [Oligoflexia bacterium]
MPKGLEPDNESGLESNSVNEIKSLRETNDAYIRLFSRVNKQKNSIKFTDNELPEMYDHNFYRVLKIPAVQSDFEGLIYYFIKEGHTNLSKHLQLIFSPSLSLNKSYLNFLEKEKFSVSKMLYMSAPIDICEPMKRNNEVNIYVARTKADLNKFLAFDIMINKYIMGEAFASARAERRAKTYEDESKPLDVYICSLNGMVIGSCDFFLHEEILKLEDFQVADSFQRRGFGTTIFKTLMEIARKKGAKAVFVNTEASDTSQEMYRKIGLCDVGFEYRALLLP